MSEPVVVIGAGVIGLTVALELKRKIPSLDITVLATFLPGDIDTTYTSPYAGANWFSFASSTDLRLQKIDEESYHVFERLADDPQAGIWRKKNALYSTEKDLGLENGENKGVSAKSAPWYDGFTNGRELSVQELIPGTVYGREFDGFVISVPVYLAYLAQKCLKLGIVIKRVPRITNIEKARSLHSSGKIAKIVVNCAGLLAAQIVGVDDPSYNYAVRGQVLVVRNAITKVQMVSGFDHPNEALYVFPRKEGGAIIGGSFHKDNWDSDEDTELTQRIVARAKYYLPELVDPSKHGNPENIDIVSVNVGLRPFREAGPRIERDPCKRWLIHGYGAGGGGYQGSYGFAKEIVELVHETLPRLKL